MIDPREVFFARAAALDRLVISGDITLDEAFNGLVSPFFAIMGHCTCAREIMDRLLAPAPKRRRAA
jgi:hypothetical protein